MSRSPARRALVVIDVQAGFDDPSWGPANNPQLEVNVARLVEAWRARSLPVVFVRHDSAKEGSVLAPGTAGNRLKVAGEPDLLVTKRVHSAFYGQPDLDGWLQREGISRVAICGIATDHCCETTARMAGDLGYDTELVLDATRTFDRRGPDGTTIPADEVARRTAASLHDEFCQVVDTDQLLSELE
ncbi:MAG: cysteine hydrolase family protein [Candidatus Dormiibacterota bacterium]